MSCSCASPRASPARIEASRKMAKPQAAAAASRTAERECPATPARSCAAVAYEHDEHPRDRDGEADGRRHREMLAQRDGGERGERTVDRRDGRDHRDRAAADRRIREAEADDHSRLRRRRSTRVPCPVGCCGSPSQTANGITSAIPISCTQTSACSDADQPRRAIVESGGDPPRDRRTQRGHDHEHQEMTPVVARAITIVPSAMR